MLRMVQSLLFWGFLLASSILLFPVALVIFLVTLPFDRRRVLLHAFTCFWASLYTWMNPAWPVVIADRHKLERQRACVMVANHLSLLDILVLFRLFAHFKWVSKEENFRAPFVGWNMRLNGYISLKRGDSTSIVKMLRQCEETLDRGSSIMMFPEGTRSPSGRMRAFRTGAFEIALKAGVPIQPLVIQGTANALPKRNFVLQGRHPIRVTVLDPLEPESFAGQSAEQLRDRVRELIAARLTEEPRSAPRSESALHRAHAPDRG